MKALKTLCKKQIQGLTVFRGLKVLSTFYLLPEIRIKFEIFIHNLAKKLAIISPFICETGKSWLLKIKKMAKISKIKLSLLPNSRHHTKAGQWIQLKKFNERSYTEMRHFFQEKRQNYTNSRSHVVFSYSNVCIVVAKENWQRLRFCTR